MKIEIYTDGACSGNPGKGGYGIVMKIREKNYEKRFSEGYLLTTNNRMELLAVIVALEKLKTPQEDVHIYTDSKYVSDAINKKWLDKWIKKGFSKVKNDDLWRRFVTSSRFHTLTFHWIKGHNGHPENEFCDRMAVEASQKKELLRDSFFENLRNGGLF